MASISKDGGASLNEHELSDAELPSQTLESIIASRPTLGTVKPSVRQDRGMDYSLSSRSASSSRPSVNPFHQPPAPTTESHSHPDRAESSSVDSTVGSGPETEPQQSDEPELPQPEPQQPEPAPVPRKTPSKKAMPARKSASTQPRSRAMFIDNDVDDFDEFE
jgi:hypothetical protein